MKYNMKYAPKNPITFWTGILTLGLTLGLGIQFVTAWQAPPTGVTPPGGNVAGPITTSNIAQTKAGAFTASGLTSNGAVNACDGTGPSNCSHLRLNWSGSISNYLRGNTYFKGVLYREETPYYLDLAASSRINDLTVDNNVILGGSNSWILHSPDDGRNSLHIAPDNNAGNWNWGQEVRIENGGLFTNGYGPLPNGWNGIHTWDVHARASVRANTLCLGGGQNGDATGQCISRWSDVSAGGCRVRTVYYNPSTFKIASSGMNNPPVNVGVGGATVGDIVVIGLPATYNYTDTKEVCGPPMATVSSNGNVRIHWVNTYENTNCKVPAGNYQICVL